MSVQHITWAYQQEQISTGAKFLLVTLANYADHRGIAWPGQERLAKDMNASTRSIRNWAEELTKSGLLSVEYRQGDGTGRKTNVYTLSIGQPDNSADCHGQPEICAGQPEPVADNTKDNLKTNPSIISPSRFAEFWKAYPRKCGDKAACERTWKRKKLDAIADKILKDIAFRLKNDKSWEDKQFIPHPRTYINGERWNDETQPISDYRAKMKEYLLGAI